MPERNIQWWTPRACRTGRVERWSDQETETVQLHHDEAEVTREPITDGEPTDAELADETIEVTLGEEVPVVGTRTVAKEEVRVDTHTETDEEQVSGEVRREGVEVEEDGRRTT